MPSQLHDLNGIRVLELDSSGAPIGNCRDALDLIGEAATNKADMVAVPLERLTPGFFDLKTRAAGEMIQKFSTYGVRLAIVGDVSNAVESSSAFRDFVRESNRGTTIWFVENFESLKRRLLSAP
ncbi:MAG TPA: DUF4180 domain-containing protein [Terriglobales bacterium]|jgi:hypothetical protein|nr:DUF4180 domain-containing protein [Terriglobales bacterium]